MGWLFSCCAQTRMKALAPIEAGYSEVKIIASKFSGTTPIILQLLCLNLDIYFTPSYQPTFQNTSMFSYAKGGFLCFLFYYPYWVGMERIRSLIIEY